MASVSFNNFINCINYSVKLIHFKINNDNCSGSKKISERGQLNYTYTCYYI